MTVRRDVWMGALFGLLGLGIAAFFAGPPLYAEAFPPPPAAVHCPEERQQLAGHHFDRSGDLVQADLVCADLRDAVLDGVDLTQADLSGADLRGASLRHATLIQADLTRADLRGADLSRADLTQADLSGTDLRGAHLWLTGTVQADTDHVRLGIVERGAVQVAYLLVVGALVLLVRPLVRIARRSPAQAPAPGRRLRPQVRRLLLLAVVAPPATLVLWQVVGAVGALWAVRMLVPLLLAEGILALAILVEQLAPAGYRDRERSI